MGRRRNVTIQDFRKLPQGFQGNAEIEFVVVIEDSSPNGSTTLSDELKIISDNLEEDVRINEELDGIEDDLLRLSKVLSASEPESLANRSNLIVQMIPSFTFYCCAICQRECNDLRELEVHAGNELHSGALVHQFELLTCKVCSEAPFRKPDLMVAHLKSIHKVEGNQDRLVDKIIVFQMCCPDPAVLMNRIKTFGNGVLLPPNPFRVQLMKNDSMQTFALDSSQAPLNRQQNLTASTTLGPAIRKERIRLEATKIMSSMSPNTCQHFKASPNAKALLDKSNPRVADFARMLNPHSRGVKNGKNSEMIKQFRNTGNQMGDAGIICETGQVLELCKDKTVSLKLRQKMKPNNNSPAVKTNDNPEGQLSQKLQDTSTIDGRNGFVALSSLLLKKSVNVEAHRDVSKLNYDQLLEYSNKYLSEIKADNVNSASCNPPPSLVASDSLCPRPKDRLNNANLTILPKRKPIGMRNNF